MRGLASILNVRSNFRAVPAFWRCIWTNRELTWEMTKREFTDRFAGQAMGVAWGLVHPIILILIYIFVFSCVFKLKLDPARMPGGFDYTVYVLAGLVPWLCFAEVLSKSTQAIVGSAELVKQVIFPVEILPVKTVLAASINQVILLAILLLYMLIRYQTLPLTVLLLPVLLALGMAAMLGVSMVLASVGAYCRDLKDVIQVLCTMNIYLMPIAYLPEWVPSLARPLLYLNPFSYMIWCYQDVLCHGKLTHGAAWVVYPLTSLLILGIGYRIFRRLKTCFGNLL